MQRVCVCVCVRYTWLSVYHKLRALMHCGKISAWAAPDKKSKSITVQYDFATRANKSRGPAASPSERDTRSRGPHPGNCCPANEICNLYIARGVQTWYPLISKLTRCHQSIATRLDRTTSWASHCNDHASFTHTAAGSNMAVSIHPRCGTGMFRLLAISCRITPTGFRSINVHPNARNVMQKDRN